MELMCAGFLLLLLLCSASAGYESSPRDPASEWQRMEPVTPKLTQKHQDRSTPQHLPRAAIFEAVPALGAVNEGVKNDPASIGAAMDVFKPEKGARPLPLWVKEMLLSAQLQTGGRKIEVLCDLGRMIVGVRRDLFMDRWAGKDLYLGTCRVNGLTATHYILHYLLSDQCGFLQQTVSGRPIFYNSLHYKPEGDALRDMPFSIRLLCQDQKHFQSFAVGFYPVLEGGTAYKRLRTQNALALPAPGAPVIELLESKVFTLGEAVNFQARQPSFTRASGSRIYVHMCYITTSNVPGSYPRYTVIANHGCMVDSKVSSGSAFLPGPSAMVQKFSVAAMILKGSFLGQSQQLYMHCEVSVGSATPNPYCKACNYDPATSSWKELYGNDYVCSCCDSICSAVPQPTPRKVVSSSQWEVSNVQTADPDLDFEMEDDMDELEEDFDF